MVEKLKGIYRGQKPIALVARKTTPKIPRMMANAPEMAPVKYRIAMATAITKRTIRSVVLIFLVMTFLRFGIIHPPGLLNQK
jgi:hypothetical protein